MPRRLSRPSISVRRFFLTQRTRNKLEPALVAAPLALLSGLMQSPAMANKLGWIARLCSRQAMRTVHFAVLCWFVLFICLHVTLVFITGLRLNLNYIFAGVNDSSWCGLFLFAVGMSVVIAAWPADRRYADNTLRSCPTLVC